MVRDSLSALLETNLPDNQRVEILLQLSVSVQSNDHQKALAYTEDALELAQEAGDSLGILNACYYKGRILVAFAHDFEKGAFHLQKAALLARQLHQPQQELGSLRLLGYVQHSLQNFDQALKLYERAMELAVEQGDRSIRIDILLKLAEVHTAKGDTAVGGTYYRTVLELEEKDDFASAAPETLVALGMYFETGGDPQAAQDFFQRALVLFEATENHRWHAFTYGRLSIVQLEMGKGEEALQSGLQGLGIAEKYHLNKELADNHLRLSMVYDSLGNHKRALYHFRELSRLKEEVFSLEKADQINTLQAEYELSLKEEALERSNLENELQSKRIKITYLAAGLVIFVLGFLALIVYRGYRQKMRINTQLEDRVELKDMALGDMVKQLRDEITLHEETRAQLETSHEELNHFIYKSSHDLRGPLASVIGLVSLAEMDIPGEEKAKYLHLIRVSTEKISTKLDSLVHATHLKEKELEISPIDLSALVKEVTQTIEERSPKPHPEVDLQLEPNLILKSDPTLITNLLSNLIENGFRFMEPSRENPMVRIKTNQEGEGIRILIEDNGQGIPSSELDRVFEMFVRTDFKKGGSGLGLYVVKHILERLNGEIDLSSTEGEGTSVHVLLPFKDLGE